MARLRHVTRVAALSAVAALAVSLTACSSTDSSSGGPSSSAAVDNAGKSETFYGDTLSIGEGTVKTFVTTGEGGKPVDVGFTFDAAALQGLPEPPHDAEAGPPPASQPLHFPKQAKGLALDHATFDYVPGGHPPPGVFDKNHFDIHFFYISQDEVETISPTNPDFMSKGEKLPAAKYTPKDYAPIPNMPPEEIVVPGMGQHLVDSTQPLVPGDYKFDQILIAGTWDGQYACVEPMVTLDYLLSKPDLTTDLKLPEAYQKSGLYPTKYRISFDPETNMYKVSLTGLVERTAS